MDMRELREKAEVTKREAVYKLDITENTLKNWENGNTEPTIGVFKTSKLLKLYKCSFEDLVEAVRKSKSQVSLLP